MSLHYSHAFAVQNRIDVSDLSDVPMDKSTTADLEDIAHSIIPSSRDDKALRENIAILVTRVLVAHLKFFKVTFEDVVEWHIRHQFYQEMSEKSLVVSIYLADFLWHQVCTGYSRLPNKVYKKFWLLVTHKSNISVRM